MRLDDLTWYELDALTKAGPPILILPTGSLEQHGPHLPLNTDTILPLAVADRVAAQIGALVAPPLPYGYKSQPKSGGGNHFPGCASLDGATYINLVRDLICDFARHGLTKIVLFDGHMENQWFLTEAADLARALVEIGERRRVGADADIGLLDARSDDHAAVAVRVAIARQQRDAGGPGHLRYGGIIDDGNARGGQLRLEIGMGLVGEAAHRRFIDADQRGARPGLGADAGIGRGALPGHEIDRIGEDGDLVVLEAIAVRLRKPDLRGTRLILGECRRGGQT